MKSIMFKKSKSEQADHWRHFRSQNCSSKFFYCINCDTLKPKRLNTLKFTEDWLTIIQATVLTGPLV